MPAGDLLTSDWQVELRTTLTGQGTAYPIEYGGVSGLGDPGAKAHDTDLGHDDGAHLGRDYTAVRVVTIAYVLRGTPAATGANFLALKALWAVSLTDLPLHLQLPGFGHLSFTGRPRGLADDLSELGVGVARALATFVCGDPTMTVVP